MDVNQSKQGRSDRDRVRIDGYQTGVEVEEGVEIEIISLEQVMDDNPADAADAGEDVGGGIVTMEIGNGDDAFGWNQQGGVRGGVGGGIDNGINRLCDLTSAMDHSDGNNNTMSHLDQDMNSTDGNHFDFGLEDDLRERLSSAGSGHDDLIKGSTRPSSSRSYVVGGELNVDDRDNNDVFDDELRSDDGYTISSLTPLERFRKAGRQVKFMCGVQISLNKCAEEAGKGTFSIQIADLMEKMSRTPSVVYVPEHSKERLSFNATDYRSKYEFTWPETAKDVLVKAPVDRTPDDIRLVRSLMRGLYSFRKYSRNLQDLICKVIRYAKYGRRRVVIRKGHPGFSFYFLFSGMAGVTLEEDEMNAFVKKEVNILKKGASFGEIALLKDSRRKATVVCLENTEFLVVDSDDFFENNLHLHIQQDFEYRMNFMSHLDLFSTWTPESIEEISDMGRMEEYCNESLIVKDARDTDWLFIVTKGRADVLKLVDLAQLYMSKQDEEEEVMQVSRKAKVLKSAFAWNEDVSSKLTKIPQHQQYQQHQQPQTDPRFPWMTGGDGHEQPQKNGKKSDVPARPKTTGQIASRTRNHIADNAHDDTAHRNRRSKSATVRLKVPSDKLDGSGDEGTNEHQPNGVYRSNSRASSANHRRTFSEPTEDMPTLPNHITLGLETIKAPGVEAGVYIQVDALRPGDFFGIQGIKGEMPHLSLVSHGCEVIRISMSKFREFADDETLAKVNKLLPTYASGLELWRSFQKQNKWRNFKNGVITDVMRHAHHSGQAAIVESRTGPRSRRSVTSDWVTNTWSRRSSMGRESTEVRNTPLPKIMTSAAERGSGPRSPRPRRRGKSAGVSNASTSRPGSRALTASRPPSTRVSDSRPPTRHSMSNHDLRILENRRSSVPASRFVSASQSLNNQPMARTLSAVGGAMSAGGEKRFNSQPSMPHLNIPDLANFTKPTFTRSRSWRELKS